MALAKPDEKNKLLVIGIVILVCLGLILSSLSKPVKPKLKNNSGQIVNVI